MSNSLRVIESRPCVNCNGHISLLSDGSYRGCKHAPEEPASVLRLRAMLIARDILNRTTSEHFAGRFA